MISAGTSGVHHVDSSTRLDELLAHIAPCLNHGRVVRLDPKLLYARISSEFSGFVLLFDGSLKTAIITDLEVVRKYCRNLPSDRL